MWVLAILVMLAIGIGFRLSLELKMSKFSINKQKAIYLARGGVNQWLAVLKADTNDYDSLNEIWSNGIDALHETSIFKDVSLMDESNNVIGTYTALHSVGKDEAGKDIYLYGASDEDSKININKASLEQLKVLFLDNPEIAPSVINWRTAGIPDDPYYEELKYKEKHKEFDAIEELILVKGVTPEIYSKIKDYITVFGDDSKVNINTVSGEVLKLVIQSTEPNEAIAKTLADAMISYRRNNFEDGNISNHVFYSTSIDVVNDLNLELAYQTVYDKASVNFKVKSSFFRVRVLGLVANSRVKRIVDIVVKKDDPNLSYLYYHEE